MFALQVLLEIAIVLLIGYGILHEDELIEFEDELWKVIKFCIRKYINNK